MALSRRGRQKGGGCEGAREDGMRAALGAVHAGVEPQGAKSPSDCSLGLVRDL